MPSITLGVTNKPINSTRQSIDSSSVTLSCKLKEPCSMQSPVFKVQGLTKTVAYNFASFGGRYYWVDDIVYLTNDIQEVHCHLDPMATYKAAIGATKAFIKYGDKTNWERKIDDLRMQPEVQPTYLAPLITTVNAFDDGVVWDRNNGTVVIRVYATKAKTSGYAMGEGIHTIAMSLDDFRDCLTDLETFYTGLVTNIFTNPSATIPELISEIAKFFAKCFAAIGGSGSWQENLLSAVYIPINISSFQAHSLNGSNTLSQFYIGSINCELASGHKAYELDSSGVYLNCKRTVGIPWSTQATTYPYLKNPRWNVLQAIMPGAYYDIDTTDLKDQTDLGWFSCINLCSGQWSGKITENAGETEEVLAATSGCIAIDMLGLVGTGQTNMGQQAAALGKILSVAGATPMVEQGATTTVTSKPVKNEDGSITHTSESKTAASADVTGMATGIIGSFLATGVAVGSASGTIGGGGTDIFLCDPATIGTAASTQGKLVLRYLQYMPVMNLVYENYCDIYGYPYNRFGQISSHSGFVQCVGASVGTGSVGFSGSPANKATINSLLNSGFYYE